jgi:Regulator of chromosome condensation (RCC1) repeat
MHWARIAGSALWIIVACGARTELDGAPPEAGVDSPLPPVVDASLDVSPAPDAADAGVDVFDSALPMYPVVRAGYDHVCAALPTGVVKCWGDNSEGELGNGTLTSETAATAVTGITNAVTVASGYRHSCAALQDGSVRCWGFNDANQVAPSNAARYEAPVSTGALDGPMVALTAGDGFTCGTLAAGPTECWGTVLTNSPLYAIPRVASALGTSVQNVTSPTRDNVQVIARDSAGAITCWDGTAMYGADCKSPTGTSFGLSTNIIDMAFVSDYPNGAETCVVTSSNAVECLPPVLRLSDGGTWQFTQPIQRIAAAGDQGVGGSACVLLTSGSIQCWNVDPTYGMQSDEVGDVLGITNAIDITVGLNMGCAALSTGHVACWSIYGGSIMAVEIVGIP